MFNASNSRNPSIKKLPHAVGMSLCFTTRYVCYNVFYNVFHYVFYIDVFRHVPTLGYGIIHLVKFFIFSTNIFFLWKRKGPSLVFE